MDDKVHLKRPVLMDLSLWSLLVSNLLVIFFATTEHWNLQTLMWIYWFQSIIIGFFSFIRILKLNEFSTEGYVNTATGKQMESTQGTKIFSAFFFLFHYGGFHFVYLIFLLNNLFASMVFSSDKEVLNLVPKEVIATAPSELNRFLTLTTPEIADFKFVFLMALVFSINHLFSYLYNKPFDTKRQKIGTLMFYPYMRIIPMHFTILLGAVFNSPLIIFLVLKTIADIVMHLIEHSILRKGEEQRVLT